MILGQYGAELVGTWWYWVSTRLLCLYILKKKVEIWSDVTIAGGQTNEQTMNKER